MRLLLALALALGLAAPAVAHDIKAGDLMIEHPHALALPPSLKMSAAYLTIHNRGSEPDRLVAVSGKVAEQIELHTTLIEDGVAKMREVEAGFEIPPGGMLHLKQGGNHIMLIGVTEPMVEGTSFPLTLVFEKAGEIRIDVAVEARGAADHGGHGHMTH